MYIVYIQRIKRKRKCVKILMNLANQGIPSTILATSHKFEIASKLSKI